MSNIDTFLMLDKLSDAFIHLDIAYRFIAKDIKVDLSTCNDCVTAQTHLAQLLTSEDFFPLVCKQLEIKT